MLIENNDMVRRIIAQRLFLRFIICGFVFPQMYKPKTEHKIQKAKYHVTVWGLEKYPTY